MVGSDPAVAPAAGARGALSQEAGGEAQAEGQAHREDPNFATAKPLVGTSHLALTGAEGAASAASSSAPVSNVPVPSVAVPGATASAAGAVPNGVDLQQTIDSVRATIALAARQGVSQARIALQPQELGDIRVHLSQTSDGLLARLTADTAAGAQTLASGRAELHQSLSSLGITLLRLDIGSGQSQGGNREGRFGADAEHSNGSSAPQGAADDVEGVQSAGEPDGAPLSSALQSGGLVDVLA
jgi:flagellar hook-length control protein FliK